MISNQKIIDYLIIKDTYISNVQSAVIQMIKNGWQPLGGVSKGGHNFDVGYAQAMVKYEKES